ncbi:MAG: sugar kinase [Candidatus Kapaibacterium sp.]|nr:MAG: sugar kinase [Candidatus Kapabacteria bacterium]
MSTRVAIGFDVGGTSIKAGVVAWDGIDARVVATCQHVTETLRSADGLIAWIAQQCERWQSEYPAVEAVGIGFPACIEWDSGIVAVPPNIPWWPDVPFPLRTALFERLSLPVALDNDANVAAHAECLLGYGRQWPWFLFVTLGTGVGGAIVAGGRIFRGERGFAGELGHVIIDARAPIRSPAFRTGVLEEYVGRAAIIERVQALLTEDPTSALHGGALDVDAIGRAAESGDRLARRALEDVGRILALGLASALALLGLERVVVGGGISQLPPLFYEHVCALLRQHALPAIAERVTVVRSMVGPDAGILGAALLALGVQKEKQQ